MIKIIKKISLEVCEPNLFKAIVAKQFDSKSRFLKVTFIDDNKKIDIPEAAEVIINAQRSDGEKKSFAGETNNDGTVTVPLTSWMLELAGVVTADVSVIDSEGRKLTSSTFIIEVEVAACDNGDISEDENYDILVKLIEDVKELQKNGGGGGGVPGYSPTVEVEETDNGHKVSITDVNGKKEFEVKNGKDGINGKDGYTPQKGIDYVDGEKGDKGDKGDAFTYEDFTAEQLEALKGEDYVFTESDKNEIVADVLSALPVWNGGAY